MFGKLGAGELMLIGLIALVVLGPSRLPELGKSMGKAIGEFKHSKKKFDEETKNEIKIDL